MYEVTVEDTFSSGHFLRNYKGKCETNKHLKGVTSGRVWVKDITIWETDTTTATYSE